MKLRTTAATTAATAVAATAAVLAVAAATPAIAATAASPTSLTLKASTTHAEYGQWVALSAHLGPTASNRTVEIDNDRSIVKKGRVDAHGNLTAWVKAAHNATFVAKFTGDSRDKAATAHVRINTAAQITARFINGSAGADGYTVYLAGVGNWPELQIEVAPDKSGEPVTTHIQQLVNGSWINVTLSDPDATLLNGSHVQLTYDKLWPGLTFREYVSYAGDATNTGSSTNWQYAQIAG
ncbi:hypothetical protein [Streptacidiphilus sp. EB129]|uniref:hypothetical protein n=1 Tax=Streptacidiphilus sp. EB129 TaxID=3156262 RepID=UPI003514BFD0